MSAPVRIVYGQRNSYRLDPYVRDAGGRFAPKPATTPPPLEAIEAAGTVRSLYDGRVLVGQADGNVWNVRVTRNQDGTYNVACTPAA